MKILDKLLVSNLSVVFIILLAGGFVLYFTIEDTTGRNIQKEMHESLDIMFQSIESSLNIAIKNHLRSEVNRFYKMVNARHTDVLKGRISKRHAFRSIRKYVQNLSMTRIGKTGYLAVFNSQAKILFHPHQRLGTDLGQHKFIQNALKNKQGYMEYLWRNTPNEKFQAKAAAYKYFKPWDMYLWASAYKHEFNQLISVQDFRTIINHIYLGDSGHLSILDRYGNILLHPTIIRKIPLQLLSKDNKNLVDKIIYGTREGTFKYFPKDMRFDLDNEIIIHYRYLPNLDWYLVAKLNQKEVLAPLYKLRILIIVIIATTITILGLALYFSSSIITKPLDSLLSAMKKISAGDFETKAESSSKDEFGELGRRFNSMTDFLRQRMNSITQQNEEISEQNILLENIVKERSQKLMAHLQDHKQKQGTIILPQDSILAEEKIEPSSNREHYVARFFNKRKPGSLFGTIPLDQHTFAIFACQIKGPSIGRPILHRYIIKKIRKAASWNRSPSEICTLLNMDLMHIINDLRYYVTMYYGKLNVGSGLFQYCNGGHFPFFILRKNTTKIHSLDSEGFMLGIMENPQFHDYTYRLLEQDRLLIFARDIFSKFKKNPAEVQELLYRFRTQFTDSTPEKFVENIYFYLHKEWQLPLPFLRKTIYMIPFTAPYQNYDKKGQIIPGMVTYNSEKEENENYNHLIHSFWQFNNKPETMERVKNLQRANKKDQAMGILYDTWHQEPDNFIILDQLLSMYMEAGDLAAINHLLSKYEERQSSFVKS